MTKAEQARRPEITLPDLQLVWPDGRPIRLSDYRQDRSLVALFSGGAECGPCRHAIMNDVCGQLDDYEQLGAVALLVLSCSSFEAELVRRREGLAVPVLLDPAGDACRLLGAQSPDGKPATAIVVTDCAGRVFLASRPDENSLPPTREAILNCLRSISGRSCADLEE